MKVHGVLLGWFLLVQSAALPADNPHRVGTAYSPWEHITTFATKARCEAARTRLAVARTTFYRAEEGVIVRYAARCVKDLS